MASSRIGYIAGAVIFFCAAILPGKVHAETIALECDGCTLQQMRVKAVNYANRMPIPSSKILYVLNASGDISKKYSVARNRDGGRACENQTVPTADCQPYISINDMAVESQVSGLLEYMRVAAAANVGYADPRFPSNVYEDISYPQKRAAINADLNFRFESYIFLASGAWSLGINIFSPIRINYADGSYSKYSFNVQSQQWEPVETSYVDAFGNSVPLKIEQLSEGRGGVTTRFEFPVGAVADKGGFVNALINVGALMTTGSSNLAGGRVLVCVSTVGNNRVTVSCHWE